MELLYMILACLILGGFLVLGAMPLVHAYQLESYHAPQYVRWVREHLADFYYRKGFMIAAVIYTVWQVGFLYLHLATGFAWLMPVMALGMLAIVLDFLEWKEKPAKKPLVFTARIKRLLVGMALVITAVLLVITLLLDMILDGPRVISMAGLLGMVLLPAWVWLAGKAMEPIENAVKMHYYREAQSILRGKEGLVRIGITGSYGKTSCKVILGAILGEKFRTYITPHSYNTPMGVTRAVRESMPADTEVFVAEMGARHVGDIKEMCDLVAPHIGLITSVGPQHLETFGDVETVAATKYELIEALPHNAFCAFPAENPYCLDMYMRTENRNKALFGMNAPEEAPEMFLRAEDVAVGPDGSTFTLVDGLGNSASCRTCLLGRHNITNILGCASVARHLGMSLEEIARGIEKAPAVEHRLQLIPTDTGVTVIDDAFNASPDGTRAALDVLAGFEGRKIIVTPGLVELGDREEAENEEFGRRMAAVADIAILVARNGEAMERGMLDAGAPAERIIRVGSLAEASEVIGRTTMVGDVVLFENDLPDHYES